MFTLNIIHYYILIYYCYNFRYLPCYMYIVQSILIRFRRVIVSIITLFCTVIFVRLFVSPTIALVTVVTGYKWFIYYFFNSGVR